MNSTSSSSPALRSCRIVPGLHDEDASALELVALRRVAEVDGQRALEDYENLLLNLVRVASANGARWVAPDVRARLCHRVGESRDRSSAPVVAGLQLELARPEDRVHHDGSIPERCSALHDRRTIGAHGRGHRRAGDRARVPTRVRRGSPGDLSRWCSRARRGWGRRHSGARHRAGGGVGVLVLQAQPVESETTLS